MKAVFHPLLSIFRFLQLFFSGRIKSNRSCMGKYIKLDGEDFLIFRHMEVKPLGILEKPAVLVLRFRFPHCSIQKDRIESFFQIPIFAGLPGFCGKLWTFNERNGYFQGIYQWESDLCAQEYLKSFAGDFIQKKALSGSIYSNIFCNTSLCDILKEWNR